jgi:hypothetical protein
MAIVKRRFKESPWEQGEDERIHYTLDTTPWGATESLLPVNPVTTIKDEDGEDVSDEHLEGDSTVDGTVVTTPLVVGLIRDLDYRIEVLFDLGFDTYEAYGIIKAKE